MFPITLRKTYRIASVSRFIGLFPVIFLLPAFGANEIASSFETWQLLAATLVSVWQTALFNIALPLMADHRGRMPPFLAKVLILAALTSGIIAFLTTSALPGTLHPVAAGLLVLAWSLNIPEHLAFAQSRKNTLLFLTGINLILPVCCMVVPVWAGLSAGWFWAGTGVFLGVKAVIALLQLNISPKPNDPAVPRHFLLACLQGLVAYGGDFVAGWVIRIGLPESFLAYRYGMKELPAVLLVSNAISNEFSMTLRMSGPEHLTDLRLETGKLMNWAFPVTWLGLIIVPVIFWQFPDPGYQQAIPVYCIGALLTLPRVWFPQAILRAKMAQRVLTMMSVVEMIVYLGLLSILIPVAGAAGAVTALVLSAILEKGLLARSLWADHQIAPDVYLPVRNFAYYAVITLSLSAVTGYFFPTLLNG